MSGALADFDDEVVKRGSQGNEWAGDVIEMATLLRGIRGEQRSAHLVLRAARLATWELVRDKVAW